MGKRVHLDPKSQSKSMTSAPELGLFGQPQLLEGENAADYHELVARLYAAVKPLDIIDEMFIADVASLQWEVLRWRRLKLSLIRTRGLKAALRAFLNEKLDYDLYSGDFAERLTEILQDNLPEDRSKDFAQTLAHACARHESEAVDKVFEILDGINRNINSILDDAQAQKAEELVQGYVRGQPEALTLIRDLLDGAGVSMDDLVAETLAGQLDLIERVDRLTTIAESRRNASLREIDRRRAVLGQTLRRSLQEVEDAEFKVIEPTPTKGNVRLEERSQN